MTKVGGEIQTESENSILEKMSSFLVKATAHTKFEKRGLNIKRLEGMSSMQ